MVAVRRSTGLVDDLEGLALALEALDLRTSAQRGKQTSSTRDQLVKTIRSYLVPRLVDPDVPLCVVFAGPTGSGKSTLINSISGLEVARTGPLRPTTAAPVALVSASNRDRFSRVGSIECGTMVGGAPILETMALVDTPDIDSTSTHHRVVAEELVDNADVVVFVTSALRYADAVPWEVLRRAVSRGARVINVLNRYGSTSSGAYVDFRRRLAEEGLDPAVVRVPEHHLEAGAHSVPSLAVRELARELVLAGRERAESQQEVLDRVLGTTIDLASDVVVSVEDDETWIRGQAVSIRSEFVGRASHIDLSSAVVDVDFGFPGGQSSRRKRRWMRRSSVEVTVNNGIAILVEADIRSLGLLDPGTPKMLAGTLAGWENYTRRVARERPEAPDDLATCLLSISAVKTLDPEMVDFVLGDEGRVFIDRVRRELTDRLQAVYTQVGEHLVDRLSADCGQPRAAMTKERISAVVTRSHFQDA